MTRYWMLEVRGPRGATRAVVARQPDLGSGTHSRAVDWLSGGPLGVSPPADMEFQLSTSGAGLTDFFPPAIPLMSATMLEALAEAGVDNIESYPVRLVDPLGQPIPEEFRAVNIIGRVACADLEASQCECDDPDDPIGVDFDSLVIDEDRAEGHRFFRLHEAANGIVVHDSVRRALEPLGLRGVIFVRPEDWIG
jgi:hypothetical protein